MAAEASGASAPLGTQERLGQEMARGARGDCLKGEYAGSGMGLLSLPFWLVAEKCCREKAAAAECRVSRRSGARPRR